MASAIVLKDPAGDLWSLSVDNAGLIGTSPGGSGPVGLPSFFRYDGSVFTPNGQAVPGANIAVMSQPASFATQPGSPLVALYAASGSNAATIIAASWNGGQISFTFSATPPADVVPGSYIAVSGVTPSTYNTTVSNPYLVLLVEGNLVVCASLSNPGTYVSGGTIATSAWPNPTQSDNNGNYFFYTVGGIYSVQIYSPVITERDLPDQDVGISAGGSGSVTSVGLSMPAQFSVSNSPITTAGTIAVGWSTEAANLVLAGPTSGVPAVPTFRALTASDFPAGLGQVTSVGLALSLPSFLTPVISGSPVTTSGTLTGTVTLANQSANTFLAGPTSGSPAAPTFRTLGANDIVLPLLPSAQTNTVGTSAVAFGSATSVASVVLTMPASGGPFRVRPSFNAAALGTGSVNGISFWISDGVNTWSSYDFAQTAGMNGATVTGVSPNVLSPVTYTNGTVVTLTLMAQGSHSGSSWVIQSTSLVGPGLFTLGASVESVT